MGDGENALADGEDRFDGGGEEDDDHLSNEWVFEGTRERGAACWAKIPVDLLDGACAHGRLTGASAVGRPVLVWVFLDCSPERGFSYGGVSAMRVPAILEGYTVSICSANFNEWIRKTTALDAVTTATVSAQRFSSYMFTGEYEMMDFNLAHTFNYAEMVAMIAPRAFMVERGHDEAVGSDEWVAFEYAPVRRLYTKLGIPRRTAIEWFEGGHVIHGEGTFVFLHEMLK